MFPRSLSGKESACQAGDSNLILGWKDPLEKEMATHSCILAWEIPWTQEPGGLQSLGSQRDGYKSNNPLATTHPLLPSPTCTHLPTVCTLVIQTRVLLTVMGYESCAVSTTHPPLLLAPYSQQYFDPSPCSANRGHGKSK